VAKVCGWSIAATSLPSTQRSFEKTILGPLQRWLGCLHTLPCSRANSGEGNIAVKK